MTDVFFLFRLVRWQLALRSVIASSLVALLVVFFSLVSSTGVDPIFSAVPWLTPVREWTRALSPWTVFVIAFVVINLFEYIRVFSETLVDRFNLATLVANSVSDLRSSTDPLDSLAARRAALSGRRRLLEHVLRLVPAAASLVTLDILLWLLALPIAALIYAVLALVVAASLPWMVARFTARRQVLSTRAMPPERFEKGTAPLERAELRMAQTADRLRILVDRPLERFRIGWPVLTFTIASVVAGSLVIVSELVSASAPNEKSTLLIVLLVLGARLGLGFSQQAQEVAFFASAVRELEDGDSGIEVL